MTMKNGDAFGDYKVIDLAGSGGMGAVYKIEHSITKRVEAMKLLPNSTVLVADAHCLRDLRSIA